MDVAGEELLLSQHENCFPATSTLGGQCPRGTKNYTKYTMKRKFKHIKKAGL